MLMARTLSDLTSQSTQVADSDMTNFQKAIITRNEKGRVIRGLSNL